MLTVSTHRFNIDFVFRWNLVSIENCSFFHVDNFRYYSWDIFCFIFCFTIFPHPFETINLNYYLTLNYGLSLPLTFLATWWASHEMNFQRLTLNIGCNHFSHDTFFACQFFLINVHVQVYWNHWFNDYLNLYFFPHFLFTKGWS